MIELPDRPAPNGVSVQLVDYSLVLRPPLGGAVQKFSRAGGRYRIEATFPPMDGDVARKFIARLLRAKREGGLRMEFPLLDVQQGLPGAPVVDGAGQAGTTLQVRGLAAYYSFKEGYWISIVDASGKPYLHNVNMPIMADALGGVSIAIEPPLRTPFADGATILIAHPIIEGFIDGGEFGWAINLAHHYGLSFTLEESA